uniref:NADH-ubiquinone oxidoreductase chain 6 n=1 Tax=Limnonectes fragilis TaxID=291939 RepID=K9J8I5_LIMFA|nr:NADH dehydrogenase subunit 6 [Limnonectes fragilis]
MMKELCLLVGMLAVASNPSPYFGALGLVWGAGVGCLVLIEGGVSFLALVLFLVYLGGMMVVFGYCAALVAEPYPEAWGSRVVVGYLGLYFLIVLVGWGFFGGCEEVIGGLKWGMKNLEILGMASMYQAGGLVLMLAGWGLLVTLFVALEIVRGHKSGALQSV